MAKAPTKATKSAEEKAPKAKAKATKTVEAKAETKRATAATAEAKPKKVKAAKAPKEHKSRCGGKVCKIANCKGEYKSKGYCVSHYREWRHGKYGKTRYKPCSDTNCKKPMGLNRFGFCEDHYQNYYVKGVVQAKAPAAKAEEKSAAPAAAAS